MKSETSKDSWLKAAVIGSIWASFEIVFGSFFHNLRLPFAGTFLTFFGIVLLTTYSFKWHDKNLFLRAGIICALMRSVSPTAIIIGPLIGILLEAVIFQMIINFSGRHLFSYVLAGILAMFGAVIHKIISILIIYGWDIITVVKNFYFYLLKISYLKLPLLSLLYLITSVYILAGILSALFGFFLGKKAWNKTPQKQSPDLNTEKNLFTINNFYYSPVILLFHPLLIAIGLFLLENFKFWYAVPLVLFYLILSLIRYGKALRRFAKPIFWIQLFIVLVVTTLFWNGFSKDNWLDAEGLQTGIRIILRALLLVVGFSSMSVELKNPLIKTLLFRKGFSELYLTAELAVSALPFLIKQIVSNRFFLHPVRNFTEAIGFSDILLDAFKQQTGQERQVYIITGETRSGKTTFLKATLEKLKTHNKKLQGIIAHGIDKNNDRQGFNIEDIETGTIRLLCNKKLEQGDKHYGKFYFKSTGLAFGKKSLSVDSDNPPDFLIIDEIGPLELKGGGWYQSIENILKKNNLPMIWVVRKKILEKVLHTWTNLNYHILDISKLETPDIENFYKILIETKK